MHATTNIDGSNKEPKDIKEEKILGVPATKVRLEKLKKKLIAVSNDLQHNILAGLARARELKVRVHAPYAPRIANKEFKKKGYDFNEDYILSSRKKGTWYFDTSPEKAIQESVWLKDKWNVESIITELTPQINYTPEIIYGISTL